MVSDNDDNEPPSKRAKSEGLTRGRIAQLKGTSWSWEVYECTQKCEPIHGKVSRSLFSKF